MDCVRALGGLEYDQVGGGGERRQGRQGGIRGVGSAASRVGEEGTGHSLARAHQNLKLNWGGGGGQMSQT